MGSHFLQFSKPVIVLSVVQDVSMCVNGFFVYVYIYVLWQKRENEED